MPAARLFTISGRVQGVFFRDSTRREALALGLTGYAVNLGNGDVEVLACGEAAQIERLAAWLQSGPPAARVSRVEAQDVEAEQRAGFRTG